MTSGRTLWWQWQCPASAALCQGSAWPRNHCVCCPSRLSLPPQDGDLQPWCFIGARQRAGRSRAASQGFQPAPHPQGFGNTGASSEGGSGPLPISPAESSSPEPPCSGTGVSHWASLGGCGCECPRTQPAPWDTHTDHSLALPELASLPSCLRTHQPHSSQALEHSRSNIYLELAQAGFTAGIAAAPVLRRELEATPALPQKQPQVTLRRWIWTQSPLIQAWQGSGS